MSKLFIIFIVLLCKFDSYSNSDSQIFHSTQASTVKEPKIMSLK